MMSRELGKRLAPPLFFAALLIAFFPRLATLNYLLAAKDTLTFSYPAQVEFSRALRAGYFPLWSAHLNSPLFAEGQGAFAHPLALLLFALFPAGAASNLFLLTHIYFGLLFTYLLAREWGQSRVAAAFAAPAFALSAFFLTRLGIYTIITNGVWLPGLLWLAARHGRTGDARYALAGAAGGALALLAGQFQLACYAVVAAGLYSLFAARGVKRRVFGFAVFGALPAVMAAVQLLPTLELLRLSERAADTRAGEYSFWPPQFVSLLLPRLFGRSPHPAFAPVAAPTPDTYWAKGSFVESALYVGVLPLVFAALGVARRRRWFLLVAAVVAAAFACGVYTPLFAVYKTIPPFSFFRAPSRLLIFPTLALAVFAGDGLDYFRATRSRAAVYVAALLAGVTFALALGFNFALPRLKLWVERAASARAAEVTRGADDAARVRAFYRAKAAATFDKMKENADAGSGAVWLPVALLGGAAVLLAAARRSHAVATATPFVIILLTSADLYYYGYGLNPTVPAADVNKPPPAAPALVAANGSRVFSSGYDLTENTSLGLGLIHANTHAIWGYNLLTPRASLRPARAATVFDALERLYTEPKDAGGGRAPRAAPPPMNIFAAYAVKYFVRLARWNTPDVKPLGAFGPYFVYENAAAVPRVYAVSSYRVITDDAAALATMTDARFAPRREVILGENPGTFVSAAGPPPSITALRLEPLRVTCRTSGRRSGLLVLADLYYPGWRATVDGEPTRIYRANVICRAVALPAGEHAVAFVYKPPTFYVGLGVSLAGWLGVGAAVLTAARKKKKP